MMMMMAATHRSPAIAIRCFCFFLRVFPLGICALLHMHELTAPQFNAPNGSSFLSRCVSPFANCCFFFFVFVYLWFLSKCKPSKWPADTHSLTRARVFIGFCFAFSFIQLRESQMVFHVLITYTFYSLNAFESKGPSRAPWARTRQRKANKFHFAHQVPRVCLCVSLAAATRVGIHGLFIYKKINLFFVNCFCLHLLFVGFSFKSASLSRDLSIKDVHFVRFASKSF